MRSIRQREVLITVGWLLFAGSAVWVATRPVSLSL